MQGRLSNDKYVEQQLGHQDQQQQQQWLPELTAGMLPLLPMAEQEPPAGQVSPGPTSEHASVRSGTAACSGSSPAVHHGVWDVVCLAAVAGTDTAASACMP